MRTDSLDRFGRSAYNIVWDCGGVAEWFKAVVLKTIGRKSQGFESSRLRQDSAAKNSLTAPAAQPIITEIRKSPLNLAPRGWQGRSEYGFAQLSLRADSKAFLPNRGREAFLVSVTRS